MKQHSVLISSSKPLSAFEFSQGEIPDMRLTPGLAASCDPAEVLQPGYARAHRKIGEKARREVLNRYRIYLSNSWQYHIDHLIPLCLGGSNDIRNLWPHALNAMHPPALKTRLERKLLKMVRRGRMALREAQGWLTGNWVVAFYRFMGTPYREGGVAWG
jgi:hypothetical protein